MIGPSRVLRGLENDLRNSRIAPSRTPATRARTMEEDSDLDEDIDRLAAAGAGGRKRRSGAVLVRTYYVAFDLT